MGCVLSATMVSCFRPPTGPTCEHGALSTPRSRFLKLRSTDTESAIRATVASGWAEYESAPVGAFFGGATPCLRRRATGETAGNLDVSGWRPLSSLACTIVERNFKTRASGWYVLARPRLLRRFQLEFVRLRLVRLVDRRLQGVDLVHALLQLFLLLRLI